jgi:hypothetical protein
MYIAIIISLFLVKLLSLVLTNNPIFGLRLKLAINLLCSFGIVSLLAHFQRKLIFVDILFSLLTLVLASIVLENVTSKACFIVALLTLVLCGVLLTLGLYSPSEYAALACVLLLTLGLGRLVLYEQ